MGTYKQVVIPILFEYRGLTFFQGNKNALQTMRGDYVKEVATNLSGSIGLSSSLHAIAPWFCLHLLFCGPGFESQAHHLCLNACVQCTLHFSQSLLGTLKSSSHPPLETYQSLSLQQASSQLVPAPQFITIDALAHNDDVRTSDNCPTGISPNGIISTGNSPTT